MTCVCVCVCVYLYVFKNMWSHKVQICPVTNIVFYNLINSFDKFDFACVLYCIECFHWLNHLYLSGCHICITIGFHSIYPESILRKRTNCQMQPPPYPYVVGLFFIIIIFFLFFIIPFGHSFIPSFVCDHFLVCRPTDRLNQVYSGRRHLCTTSNWQWCCQTRH